MPLPRSQQVSLEATPYYHCISRCVRRAFLCGKDDFSGQSYEHRRGWVVERLAQLAEVFAVDVCAYAVMSNHYHLVLRINVEQAEGWSAREVAGRWLRIFSGSPLVKNWLSGEMTGDAVEISALEIIESWRAKLRDLSWFMRCLNENLARRANKEDACTGRFWEGRFKSQALLDEQAVVACMAYVDLNPIRAGVADLPEGSDHTSGQQRIIEHQARSGGASCRPGPVIPKPKLAPLAEQALADMRGDDFLMHYPLLDYLQLLDWTGRAVREGKRGAIPDSAPAILDRLGIRPDDWLKHQRPRSGRMLVAIGAIDRLKDYARVTGRRWVASAREAAALSPA